MSYGVDGGNSTNAINYFINFSRKYTLHVIKFCKFVQRYTMEIRKLEKDKFYVCQLSGRKVLVTEIVNQSFTDDEGRFHHIYTVMGAFYNKITGYIETQQIVDHQLKEI